MERIIEIGGKEVRMRASALIPRLYRATFGRDMIVDMRKLVKAFVDVSNDEDKQFDVLDLTIFENVAWAMAKQGDPDIPNNPDEWLDSIDGMFDIYEILPEIIELWVDTNKTTSSPKKK